MMWLLLLKYQWNLFPSFPHFLVPIGLQLDEDCLLDINGEDVLLLEGSYFLQFNVEEVLVILLYEVLSLLLLLLEDGFIFLSRFSILKKAKFWEYYLEK